MPFLSPFLYYLDTTAKSGTHLHALQFNGLLHNMPSHRPAIILHAVVCLGYTYTHAHTLQTHCTNTPALSPPAAHFHVHSCSLSKHIGFVCSALLFLCATGWRLRIHSSARSDNIVTLSTQCADRIVFKLLAHSDSERCFLIQTGKGAVTSAVGFFCH